MLKNILKINDIYKSRLIVKYFSSSFAVEMAEALEEKSKTVKAEKESKNTYKSRYNGKIKKRPWVDYTEEANSESKRANLEPFDRIKKKKCCLLMGYSGVNYFGMQRNPDMKTIEEELLSAMLKNKWISEEGYKQAQQIQFQRAARTDKGVSATRQCVSLKLPDEINIDALNLDLPEQIRVFAVKRVTKGFNSKEACNARTYTYTLPTISFANQTEQNEMENYRVSDEKLVEFNNILKIFEGTKNFHNFTSRKDFLDPSSKRFIVKFECDKPFIMSNVEFCVIKIKGQSFMLHQIRKMIGLALAIIRGLTTTATLERALTEDRIDIPMAPGLGLVLDQVHYDRYNQRYGEDGIHEPLTWLEEDEKVKEFFERYIAPTIVETEIKEKSMVNWLETLPRHSYDVRRHEDKNKSDEKTKDEDDDNDE